MKKGSPLQHERHRLPNGLKLLISENHRLPLISLNAFVLAGADQNPLEKPGLAAMTARLLDEGTGKYSERDLAEIVENIGGGLSSFSQREISGVALNLASEDLEAGFDLLSEMICHPVFPSDRFRLERHKLLNQLRAMADDPQVVCSNLLSRWVYRNTPLQHPVYGTLNAARKTTVEDIRQFHAQKYAPENTILVVVGDVDSDTVLQWSERFFLPWSNPEFHLQPAPPLKRQTSPARRQLRMQKEQVHLYIGHLGVSRTHPDYHTLQVMDVILGSGPGFTSRIPRTLRDEQGLAYSTYADISASAGIYPGRFVAYISTSPKNLREAERSLMRALRVFQEEGVTKEELAMAQDFLTGSFVFDFQSNAEVARFLLLSEVFQLGSDYPSEYGEIIRSVTVEEVARAARQHLDIVNCTRVAVGPL